MSYFAIRCPNRHEHFVKDSDGKKRKRMLCGAVLKFFANPKATFNEIFFCARCGAHWLIRRNGVTTTCTILPNVKLPYVNESMRVMGEKRRKGK